MVWLLMPIAAAAGEPLAGKFAGWADVDATGKLTSFVPEGNANVALVAALREELQKLEFVPARRDSAAVSIRTFVTGGYTLEPAGDGYVLRVKGAEAGPKQVGLDLPKPPRRLMTMNEPGWARVGFVVGRDGKPHDVVVEADNGPGEIRRNVRESVLRWRFEPETTIGAAIETPLQVDFSFAKKGATVVVPDCPSDAGGRVLAPGQRACKRIDFELVGPAIPGRTISVP